MESNKSSSTTLDVYQIVTDRIIELLEKGTIPWKQPWQDAGIPMNALSKRPYRGVNLWLLLSLGYERNLFLTWDQLKKIGGSVNKGEQGQVVIYWKAKKKEEQNVEVSEEAEGKKKEVPILRYYKVFNLSQCRDLPENFVEPVKQEKATDPILECELVIQMMPHCPEIKHKEQKAFYHLLYDYINMPKKKSFKTTEAYYAILFHELVHSTGSEKRLNRASVKDMAEFGSESYSLEELIAELGAAYLCYHTGVSSLTIDDSAAYIKGWLEKLRDDKKFIVQASGMAQRAVDFILNLQTTPLDEVPKEQMASNEQ